MKKMMSLLALALVSSVVAASAEDGVLSANAVGYIKKNIDGGALLPIVMPFELLNSDVTNGVKFSETQLATELPLDSEVYFWNESSWLRSSKDEDEDEEEGYSWSGLARSKILRYGEMFFVKPSAAGDFTLAGEVPDSTDTVVRLQGKGAMDAVGFAYPTPVKFADTQLAKDSPIDTEVYFWNGTNWLRSTKDEDEDEEEGYSWSGLARTKTLDPGEGFFVKFPGAAGLEAWEQSKPYAWP